MGTCSSNFWNTVSCRCLSCSAHCNRASPPGLHLSMRRSVLCSSERSRTKTTRSKCVRAPRTKPLTRRRSGQNQLLIRTDKHLIAYCKRLEQPVSLSTLRSVLPMLCNFFAHHTMPPSSNQWSNYGKRHNGQDRANCAQKRIRHVYGCIKSGRYYVCNDWNWNKPPRTPRPALP